MNATITRVTDAPIAPHPAPRRIRRGLPALVVAAAMLLAGTTTPAPSPPLGSSQWNVWWNTNREAVIAHWMDVTPGRSYTGWANAVMGRGRPFLPPTRLAPGKRLEVTDALIELLSKTGEINLRERLPYALARVCAPSRRTEARELIMTLLSDMSAKVRTSATFALGILGDPEATDTLVGLALDDTRARIALRQSIASDAVRGHAAMALGMLGSETVLTELVPILARDNTNDAFVQTSIVFALGMLEGDLVEPARDVLLGLIEDPPRDRSAAAMVPIALGKLGDPAALPALLALVEDGRTERDLRQSAAIALGRLALLYDDDVVAALWENVEGAAEGPMRWFSLMSLARIGARTRRGAQPYDHEQLEKRLITELREPSHAEHQPWAAMALAVYAIDHEDFRPTAIEALAPVYLDERDPDDKGAYAISLGLLGARDLGEQILDDLDNLSDGGFRGSAALALGMLAYEPAREWMLDRALDKSATAGERILLFRGLALMGDLGTTKAILGEWKTSGDARRRESLAAGLARLRNPRAIPRILEMVVEDGATQPREEAVTVLGLHADRDVPRFNELLPEDVNPYIGVPARLAFAGY